MKKLFFFLSFATILSCSKSDDDSNSNASNSDFHPPTWIQGTWQQEGSTGTSGLGFKFSSNDLCTLISTAEQCQKGIIDIMRKSGQNSTVDETITSTSYSAYITYGGTGQSVTYSFKKLSNNSIEYMGYTFIKK